MRNNRRTNGQSLVEFALIVPLLLIVLFGIIELGILVSISVGMTNSAREASRAGSVYQYSGPAPIATSSTTYSLGSDSGLSFTQVIDRVDNQRENYISTIITSTLNPIVSSTAVTTTISYLSSSAFPPEERGIYRAGDMITVELFHNHTLFFGILGPRSITIRSISTMRVEPGGQR